MNNNYLLKQYPIKDNNLKKFIRSYWILKKKGRDTKTPKLLPLANAHIIINLEDGYSVEDSNDKTFITEDYIFHPSIETKSITYGFNTHIIGIELSPQGFYYLSENNTSTLNLIEPLKVSIPDLFKFIETHMEELKDGDINVLNNYLYINLKEKFDDQDLNIIDKTLSLIERELVKDISAILDINIRTLERKFKRNTGFTLKKYQTILRLNLLLKDIYMTDDIKWAELALKHGFFDQAHMINILKKFIGITPQNYLEIRNLLGDLFEVN